MSKAQEIWDEIKAKNLGEVTAVALLEKELGRIAEQEQVKIIRKVETCKSGFMMLKPITFKLWFLLMVNWVFRPSKTFYSIAGGVKNTIVKELRKNEYA